MKKVYTFMSMIMAGIISASATNGNPHLAGSSLQIMPEGNKALNSINSPKKSPLKVAAPVADVCGQYTWSFTSALDAEKHSMEIKISEDANTTDGVVIDGFIPTLGYKVYGTYDSEKGEITLPKQKIGVYNNEDIFFFKEEVIVSPEGYITDFVVSDQPLVLTYKGDFIEMDLFECLSIGTGATDGYFESAVMNTFGKSWEEDPSMGCNWKEAGQATFCDGWQYPGYEYDSQFDHPWKVTVEKCLDIEGVYRLVDPYTAQGSPLAEYSTAKKPGYVIFNISDPDFPYVYPEHFAFEDDYGQYYQYDTNGFYHIYKGMSKEDVKATYKDELSRFENNIFTIGVSLFGNSLGERNAANSWVEYDDVDPKSSIDMSEILKSDGIFDSIIDDNATPIYYNLQGIKITNPDAGQVAIKVVNGKSQKVLF